MFQDLFIDGFAGGGGASTGIQWAIGRDVDIALNHDPVAIAVHRANHPGTEHICQDIRAVWPMTATKMRPVAGAWFSPDCKEHSKAKGGPVKDRNIRSLPWEIPTWLKDTRPTVAYIENVEEMQQWGPLDEHGHVIKDLRGTEFKRWIRTIRKLGYRVAWRELRACDYGAPTSRKRLYIIARNDNEPIVWPKPTHGPARSTAVKAGKLLPYRTAAECIDWHLRCPSIFLTKEEAREFRVKRPLEENTLRRIAHGVMRYVVNCAEPFIVPVTHSKGGARVHGVAEDGLRTITTANGGEFAVCDAVLAPSITKFHGTGVGAPMDDSMPTVTANGEPARPAGATPLGMIGATMVHIGNGERDGQEPRALDVEKPLGTAMAEGVKQYPVAVTMIQTNHSYADKNGPRPQRGTMDIAGQAPAATTSGGTAIVAAAMAPLQNGERRPGEKPREQDLKDPASTIATGGKHAVIAATMMSVDNTSTRAGRVFPPEDSLRTITGAGGGHAVVTAGLVGVGGRRAQSPPVAPDGSAPTATTKGDAAVVVAHLEKFNADTRPKAPQDPLDAVLAGAARHAVVKTELVEAAFLDRQFGNSAGAPADAPAGSTTAGGGGKTAQVSAFLSHYHKSNTNGGNGDVDGPIGVVAAGGERGGVHHAVVCAHMEQANTGMIGHDMRDRVSTIVGKGSTQRVVQTTLIDADALPPDLMAKAEIVAAFLVKYFGTAIGQNLDKPFDTVTTLPRYAVVTVTIDAVTYVIVDIGLRMLTPRELARAQGFPDSYILDPITPQLIRGKIVHKPLTKAMQIRMIGNSVCPDVARALVAANQPGITQQARMAA